MLGLLPPENILLKIKGRVISQEMYFFLLPKNHEFDLSTAFDNIDVQDILVLAQYVRHHFDIWMQRLSLKIDNPQNG